MEFKKPLDIDYEKENSQQILNKIMVAIEQSSEFNVLYDYDEEQKIIKQEEKNKL